MAGAPRARLCVMEIDSICVACSQSGATTHVTLRQLSDLNGLLGGKIPLLAYHVRAEPTPLLVLSRAER
jgi:hypothetical protein